MPMGARSQFALSQRKHGASTARTNVLIVGDAIDSVHFVTKSELMLYLFQIVDMHARSEAMSTACTMRKLASCSHAFVKFDPQLRRPLKDMEELPEGQPKQSKDHGDGVQDAEEFVPRTPQPGITHCQQQARETYRGKQNQREKIF